MKSPLDISGSVSCGLASESDPRGCGLGCSVRHLLRLVTWQVLPVQLGTQLGLHQLLLVRLLLQTPSLKAPRLRELAGWLWGSGPVSTLSCLRKLGGLTLCPSIFVVSLEANLISSCPNNYYGGLDSTESACQAGDLG